MEVEGKRRKLENDVKDREMLDENKGRQPVVLDEVFILYEILPWVPLKSLFRFKLVCKEWCRIISRNPVFKASQAQKSAILPPSLMHYGNNDYIFLPTSNQNLVGMPRQSTYLYGDDQLKYMNQTRDHLLASSNGLLFGSYYHRSMGNYLYVSNPITKELTFIPQLMFIDDYPGFDFQLSSHKPYFVVVLREVTRRLSCNETDIGFRVYTSETGVWSRANATIKKYRMLGSWMKSDGRSVFVTGNVYWKLPKDVLWFNVEKDTAGVVPVPNEEEKFSRGEIGDCNCELSYTLINATDIQIWMLTEFKWVKKYCLSLRKIIPFYVDMMKITVDENDMIIKRVCPYEGGDVVFWLSKRPSNKEQDFLFAYNVKTGALQSNYYSELRVWHSCISYKSSLVSMPKLTADPGPRHRVSCLLCGSTSASVGCILCP